jgi:hypothetical protein
LENHNNEMGYHIVTDINLIMADVKLIKCKYDNLSIDISINNFVGLCKLVFMNYILKKSFFDGEFFKRSLFLIKSWCYYEGCILGSNVGLMASYALEILVIYIFNNYSDQFKTEIEAFFTFCKVLNEIDWDKNILTIFGLVNAENYFEMLSNNDFNLNILLKNLFSGEKNEINNNSIIKLDDIITYVKLFEKFVDMDKIQNFNLSNKTINLKFMNIIDPLFHTNNLGKSVNFHSYSKIKKVFEYMTKEIKNLEKIKNNDIKSPIKYLNSLLQLFNKTVVSNNADLFLLSLHVPKILISNVNNDEFIYLSSNNKEENNNNNNNDYKENEEYNMIIQLNENFNKKFIIAEEVILNDNINNDKEIDNDKFLNDNINNKDDLTSINNNNNLHINNLEEEDNHKEDKEVIDNNNKISNNINNTNIIYDSNSILNIIKNEENSNSNKNAYWPINIK